MADSDAKRRARERFRRRVNTAFKNADAAFKGKYRSEIEGLLGLSRAEIDAMAPGVTDIQTYERLMIVVREASRVNLAQAELANRIRSLGKFGIRIAKKVPALAAILG